MFASEIVANFGWGVSSDGFAQNSMMRKMFDVSPFVNSRAAVLQYLHPTVMKLLKLK